MNMHLDNYKPIPYPTRKKMKNKQNCKCKYAGGKVKTQQHTSDRTGDMLSCFFKHT